MRSFHPDLITTTVKQILDNVWPMSREAEGNAGIVKGLRLDVSSCSKLDRRSEAIVRWFTCHRSASSVAIALGFR
jgi:hypothetical protein